jgi:hypothetical protein
MFRPGVFLLLAVGVFAPLTAPPVRADSQTVSWKPVVGAILKINGRALKTWNVYSGDKKYRVVLVLLMHRYLILDTKERAVYEIPPGDLESHDQELRGRAPGKEMKRIPSSNWYFRDLGPMELVRVRLGDYGNVLELQLPHLPDLRGLY